jgi:hypothetical protein
MLETLPSKQLNKAAVCGDLWDIGTNGGEWSASRPGRFILAKDPRYALSRKQSGPMGWAGCFNEETNLVTLPGCKPQIGKPLAQHQTSEKCNIPYH